MTWETYLKFPVPYRKWLINRMIKEINQAQEAKSDIPTKALPQNTPEMRSLLGKAKIVTPNAKMQRM